MNWTRCDFIGAELCPPSVRPPCPRLPAGDAGVNTPQESLLSAWDFVRGLWQCWNRVVRKLVCSWDEKYAALFLRHKYFPPTPLLFPADYHTGGILLTSPARQRGASSSG